MREHWEASVTRFPKPRRGDTLVNRAVTQVFLLMAQGRIPQKQAVAFGYLAQLLLQTVPGIRSEFVASFGYRSWEENLKSKLAIPPKSSFRANNVSEESLRSFPVFV